MSTWFWMSFADPDLPKGQQFLGVVILFAPDIRSAIQLAWDLGINPGGQILSKEYPESVPPPPYEFTNRLLSKADIVELEGSARTIGEVYGAKEQP